jgi:hypothetical protein
VDEIKGVDATTASRSVSPLIFLPDLEVTVMATQGGEVLFRDMVDSLSLLCLSWQHLIVGVFAII